MTYQPLATPYDGCLPWSPSIFHEDHYLLAAWYVEKLNLIEYVARWSPMRQHGGLRIRAHTPWGVNSSEWNTRVSQMHHHFKSAWREKYPNVKIMLRPPWGFQDVGLQAQRYYNLLEAHDRGQAEVLYGDLRALRPEGSAWFQYHAEECLAYVGTNWTETRSQYMQAPYVRPTRLRQLLLQSLIADNAFGMRHYGNMQHRTIIPLSEIQKLDPELIHACVLGQTIGLFDQPFLHYSDIDNALRVLLQKHAPKDQGLAPVDFHEDSRESLA